MKTKQVLLDEKIKAAEALQAKMAKAQDDANAETDETKKAEFLGSIPEDKKAFDVLLDEIEAVQADIVQEQKLTGAKSFLGTPGASKAYPQGYQPARVEDRIDIKTIGEAFIESVLYKSTVGKSRPRGLNVAVDVPIMPSQLKATFDTTSTGLQTYIDYRVGPIMVEQQRLTVRDLLSVGQTNLSSVPYIQETSYTNAATTVAEEGQKPEATFLLQDEFAPVKKIAVIAKVTDEMWNDFPTLRDYINSRLRFMVQEREEAQLLSGAGTGSEITGILTASIQSQSLAGATPAVNHANAFHNAITKIRATGKFEPDGMVVHPDDWQQMRLATDDNNQYFGGGPFTGAYGNGVFANAPRYWGLPVVVTTAITSGTGLVGAFKLGAQIWDREGITVDSTNSDEDDFQYNRMAIRVEERLALAIYRLLAFCKVTGI